jgi:enoyl-CoA hydratase
MSEPEAIIERRGCAGSILLNRPKALNALTLWMVRAIDAALDAWQADDSVTRVVIAGAGGRAFCAGGDIRLLWEQGQAGDHAAQLDFWREEYRLNLRIRRYPKPYVALVDGLVMGGGVGVSIHGSHVVAGDRFGFAMPEVGIGFFPDVGATHFLPRLPGRIGAYLGLTGARASAADATALGLATHYVPSTGFADLTLALGEDRPVDAIVQEHATPAPPSAMIAARGEIDACFASSRVSDIVAALEAAETNPFLRDALTALRAKSPTSLAIAARQVRDGAGLTFEEAMATEFRIVSRLCRGHDFYEGVRALIVDKDNKPDWRPAVVAAVSEADLDAFFAPLPARDELFPPAPS